MLENFASLLSENGVLDDDRPIVVGLSGGPDSLCLFDLCCRIGLEVVAAYFDHSLRPESTAELQAVEKLAADYNKLFVSSRGDVRKFAREQGMSVEEAARILRYEFLFSQAGKANAQAVAVGHHADDQVESILMHFIRGSGLAGLRGMPVRQIPNQWSTEIALLRPLLGFWREEILSYCKDRNLSPLEDQTNRELIYWRNRIRLELIPLLESYNPKIKQVVWRMSRSLSSDFAWIEDQVNQEWKDYLRWTGPGYVSFLAEALGQLPLAVQRRLVIRGITSIRRNARDIDFEMVERVIQAFKSPPATRQMDIGLGIRLFWEGELVWLAAWEAELPALDKPQFPRSLSEPVILSIPGFFDLGNGWRITACEIPIETALRTLPENDDPYQVWLGFKEIPGALIIRVRKPGDRFRPFGLGGHSKKLADYFINTKLPPRFREGWPLVCLGDEVLWVPGYTINDLYRLSGAVSHALSLTLTQIKADL
jgi:tRNA(Ile)-lysidine synthase